MKTFSGLRRIGRTSGGLLVLLVIFLAASAPASTRATRAQKAMPFSTYLPFVMNPVAPDSSFDVTYTPNTVVLDDAAVAAHLISISDDQVTLRFRQSAEQVGRLTSGQVLLVAGRVLRKVESVTRVGDEYVVRTGEASLNEAIATGRLALTQVVQWDALSSASFPPTMITEDGSTLYRTRDVGSSAAAAGTSAALPAGTISYTGKIQGWDVTLKLQPVTGRLNMTVSAKKSVGVANASVSGEGWIGNLSTSTNLEYDRSTATLMSVKALNVQGEMRLKWAAVSPNGELTNMFSFVIPAEIPIPARIGPIPVTLKVKAAVQVVPVMPVSQASSGGDFTATYRSDKGFSVEGSTVTSSGQPSSSDLRVSGPTVSAGYGPVGFGLGVEFPRLELAFFGQTQAFITTKAYASSVFTTEPPCQKGSLKLLAVGGYKLGLLGFTIKEGTKELWAKDYVKYLNDEPC